MKRLVVGLLLAATAYAPLAAAAQRRDPAAGPVTNDIDRTEAQERRAARQERRAARVEAGTPAQTPAPNADRPRRNRAEADRAARPDRPRRAAAPDLARPDGRGQRLVRPEDSADFADYATDPRNRRPDRLEDRDDDRREPRRDRFDDRRDDRAFDGRSASSYRGGQVWNRGWRGDTRYDWSRYRDRNRGAYRLPRYYAPQGAGYGYRRFGVGIQLSRSLFGRSYWLDDPYAYRLPPAYGPYRWVRYHGDALLVDLRSGRVIDGVYDIFY